MFELSVAWRFLREGKIQTILILVGISVGIAVQVFLSALIGGLQKDLVNRTVGTAPHIIALQADTQLRSLFPDSVAVMARPAGSPNKLRPIRSWQPVVEQLEAARWFIVVNPVADGPGFLYRGERVEPVIVRGMSLERADQIYAIAPRMKSGEARVGADGILVGAELASTLRLAPGSTVRLATATGNSGVFTVRGVFDLESQSINASWVIAELARAQTLLGYEGGITQIEMQAPRVFEAESIARALASSFPKLRWISWQENNANLLAALKSQSASSNLIQALVLAAVTLGISSVLAVSALQKARQIGILKAIGATSRSMGRVFIIQGAALGCVGAIIGCGMGYWLIDAFLKATARSTGRPLFPLSIAPSLFAASIGIATVAGALAAFIPARRSARMSPIDVIRNG